jgi:ketosteroid isomerase-like protein
MSQDVLMAQAFHDALLGKDAPAAEAVLDDASLLHIAGTSGLAGEYHGEEAILGLLERMAQLTDATLQFSVSRVLTADDQAIVLCGHSSGTRRGKRLDADAVHVLSLRGGRVREIWVFHQNQDQVDDFWSEST